MAATTPSQFRFDARTLGEIDQLKDKFGLTTRSDVIRMAVRQMADRELGPTSAPPATPTGKNNSRKKSKPA